MRLGPAVALVVLAAACHHQAPTAPDASGSQPPDAWVDPLGTDDLAHGRAAGAEAFRTITFALAHASATIHVAAGTYQASSGETFPLALTGTQWLSCADGGVVHVVGEGPSTNSAHAVVTLGGTANTVTNCDLAGTGADEFAECIQVLASGPHLIQGDTLHACPIVLDLGGASGVTIEDVTGGGGATAPAENCIEGAGDDVRLERFSCAAANDWLFGCGQNLSGCGTTVMGRMAACASSVDLSAPCP